MPQKTVYESIRIHEEHGALTVTWLGNELHWSLDKARIKWPDGSEETVHVTWDEVLRRVHLGFGRWETVVNRLPFFFTRVRGAEFKVPLETVKVREFLR